MDKEKEQAEIQAMVMSGRFPVDIADPPSRFVLGRMTVQVAIAVFVDGKPDAPWVEGEVESLLSELGRPEAMETYVDETTKFKNPACCVLYERRAKLATQPKFLNVSFKDEKYPNGLWVCMTTADIDPEIDAQRGPWLGITRTSLLQAMNYVGKLVAGINDRQHACKGGTLKLVPMGVSSWKNCTYIS